MREASILLNKSGIGEERCEVCFRPIEEEVSIFKFYVSILLYYVISIFKFYVLVQNL
jgi:hypothetical protein